MTPNILDLMKANSPRNTYLVRQERIKREGSPYYTWEVPATGPGATAVIFVPDQFPDSRKYQPLDWIEVTNNEGAISLTLTINDGDSLKIPAGVIKSVSNCSLWHIAITNDHGADTTTLHDVVVTMQKQPLTIDKWARRQ